MSPAEDWDLVPDKVNKRHLCIAWLGCGRWGWLRGCKWLSDAETSNLLSLTWLFRIYSSWRCGKNILWGIEPAPKKRSNEIDGKGFQRGSSVRSIYSKNLSQQTLSTCTKLLGSFYFFTVKYEQRGESLNRKKRQKWIAKRQFEQNGVCWKKKKDSQRDRNCIYHTGIRCYWKKENLQWN